MNKNCTRCELCNTRHNVVMGQGVKDAKIMFIGEAPGYKEDRTGLPFVGKSGTLLKAYMNKFNFGRDTNSYVTNVVKCRPPRNRTPEPDEIATCLPYLVSEILTIKPTIIVTLGSIALSAVVGDGHSVSKLRQQIYILGTTALVPTYHPSYILQSGNYAAYDEDFYLIYLLYKWIYPNHYAI